MAMGMTPDEYWHGDPYLCQQYRLAFSLKQKQKDHDLWLAGLYNYIALTTALHNFMCSDKSKRLDYPDKPMSFDMEEKQELTEEQQRQLDEATEMIKAINFFNGVG